MLVGPGAIHRCRIRTPRSPSIAPRCRSTGTAPQHVADDAVPDRIRRHPHDLDGARRSAARSRRKLGGKPWRRLGRAWRRSSRGTSRCVLNRVLMRGRPRPGGAPAQYRPGRSVRQRRRASRCRAISTFPSPDPRLRHRMAARNMSIAALQADVAALHQPGGAHLGDRAGRRAASSSRARSPPMRRSRPCAPAGRRCPMTACRSRSSPAEPRCGRSTSCPRIRDADLVTRIKGRTATVTLGRGSHRNAVRAAADSRQRGVRGAPTPTSRIRPPRCACASKARSPPPPSFWAWTA